MGKITQALKNVSLPAETEFTIRALDKRFTDLETYFQDHQSVEEKNASLKKPAPKRPPTQPYDPEQGTGTVPPKVIMGRKPLTGRR